MAQSIALIIALTGLIGSIVALLGLFRKVQSVHILVNNRLTTVTNRVDQLADALRDAHLPVPPRPDEPINPL